MNDTALTLRSRRTELRRQVRRVLLEPAQTSAHGARLQAALALPGAEPVQGALADIYFAFGESEAFFKRQSLQLALPRLASHIARGFDAQSCSQRLSRITPLATRWSVLARPSADISTRARRCSADDSRLLAAQLELALERADVQAQEEFLHHCVTCHDKLAFMLARRSVLSRTDTLAPNWEAVSQWLEQARELA